MSSHETIQPAAVRDVRTYLTDLALYRDRVFGQERSGFSAGEIADVAVNWIDHNLVDAHECLDRGAAAEPWSVRASLVRSIGPDAQWKTHLIRAVELLALGASMHDAIGPARPWVAVADRELVLLGDLLFARALVEINRGPSELQSIVEHTFRELVLNQFLASTSGSPDATSSLHAATAGGGARLAAASVRCGALIVGHAAVTADRMGRVASRLALSTQLALDLEHPTRTVGGWEEINHRNAVWLVLSEDGDRPGMAGSPTIAVRQRAAASVAERARGWLWHARSESRGMTPSHVAPFRRTADRIEQVLIHYTPAPAELGAASA